MAKTNNIIEINGKRYDATSGVLLDSTAHKQPKTESPKVAQRRPAKPVTAHAPAHARTLMRHAVKQPAANPRHLKAYSHTDRLLAPPLAKVAVNRSAKRVDPRRLSHAKHIPQSRLIRHFSDLGTTSPLPAVPVNRPNTAKPAVAIAKRVKPRTTADLLEHALQAATSHQQPAPRVAHHSRRGHKLTIASGLILAVLLIGFAGSQSLLDLRLHMASAKAGFNASLPSYRPPGFSLHQLSYGPGEVAANFHSNSNNGSYSLIRQRSAWDSQTLLDQYVAPANPSYQTAAAGGRTIYLYGSHNATWVSAGIWYVIQSNGSLSDRQVLDLASSI